MYRAERPASREPQGGERRALGGCGREQVEEGGRGQDGSTQGKDRSLSAFIQNFGKV